MQTLISLSLILSTSLLFLTRSCDQKPLADVPETLNVSFEKHIQPITSKVCIKCHSQGSRNYSDYRNAYRTRLTIRQRVVVDKSMPIGEYLNDKDRALFRDWVDQGGNR